MDTSRWEYKVLNLLGKFALNEMKEAHTEKMFNELGLEGWELVGVVPIAKKGTFSSRVETRTFSVIFKRRL